GYGCGYRSHCGYSYPCGIGRGGHVRLPFAPNHPGNPNHLASLLGVKRGVSASAAGSGRSAPGAAFVRPGPVAGPAGGNSKVVQPGGPASLAAPTKPAANHQVVGNPSNPTLGSLPGTRPASGVQSVKPASPWAYTAARTAQPGATTGRSVLPGAGTRVSQPASSTVRSSVVRAPGSMPVRTSVGYAGASGAKSFSSFGGRS